MYTKVLCFALIGAAPLLAQDRDLSLDPTLQKTPGVPGSLIDALQECDDFDRADGPMGPDWTEVSGTHAIQSNRAANTSGGNAWMRHNTGDSPWQSTVITFDLDDNTAGDSGYVAAVIGYDPATGEDIYVKVQNQTSMPGWSNYAFYTGFNSSTAGWGGFFSFPAQVMGGRVKVEVDMGGDRVNLDIDHDFDGVYDTHAEATGTLVQPFAAALGTGVGLGSWNIAGVCDNFDLNGGCGGGGSLSAIGTCPGPMGFIVDGNTPGDRVVLAYSLGLGGFPIPGGRPCAGTVMDLNISTVEIVGTATADGTGTATFGQFNVPNKACGRVNLQAINLNNCAPTNTIGI